MNRQTLYILQGVPGSGKTTLAHAMKGPLQALICSTDDYFMQDGIYKFDPSMLHKHHAQNQTACYWHLAAGKNVIIDNTNIKRIHVKPYVEHAVKLGIPVVFIRVNGPFKSTHEVPQETIDRMRNEMEDLTLESVMEAGQ